MIRISDLGLCSVVKVSTAMLRTTYRSRHKHKINSIPGSSLYWFLVQSPLRHVSTKLCHPCICSQQQCPKNRIKVKRFTFMGSQLCHIIWGQLLKERFPPPGETPFRSRVKFWKELSFTQTLWKKGNTVNPLYNDIRYNSQIRYNVNLVCTNIGLRIFTWIFPCYSWGKHTVWVFVRIASPRWF